MDNETDATGQILLNQQQLVSLREKICRAEWLVGANLPTEEELSEQYGVIRITVRHALQLLEQDGLIRKARARRTEVVSVGPALRLGFAVESLRDIVAMVANAVLEIKSYARERQPDAAAILGETPQTRLYCLRSVLKRQGRADARSTIECSPRSPKITIRIFPYEEYYLRVLRRISRTRCSAPSFGGVCFIGLILVPFAVTMSRKLSVTQTTQSVLWALTGNIDMSALEL
jgi:DNA-binding GntR family transcriptional regulator